MGAFGGCWEVEYPPPPSLIFLFQLHCSLLFFKNWKKGCPGWLSGKESACRCRRHGFNPRSGNIPHTTKQLSPCATTIGSVLWSPEAATTEPMCGDSWSPHVLEPVVTGEARTLHVEKSPCSSEDPAQPNTHTHTHTHTQKASQLVYWSPRFSKCLQLAITALCVYMCVCTCLFDEWFEGKLQMLILHPLLEHTSSKIKNVHLHNYHTEET